MKFLVIRGRNLASLEGEFEVNFTKEPLQSSGIFAITGQTGAGKSTLLDALCLALFDSAPRLYKAEQIKKENLDLLTDKISPQDCRNILRRGTGEGYAEVEFIALNGDKYRSKWMVKRARGKADGSLQPSSMELENLSHKATEQGTKRDLLNRIVELIGLTFDQFTRAVLLAQGEFANFLKARQNEKAELLEKLTGTDVYSRISTLIYEKTGEAKKTWEMTQQRIKDVKLLGEEELNALQEEKEKLKETYLLLKSSHFTTEKKLNWLKQEEQLKKEVEQAKVELKKIEEEISEAKPRYQYLALIELSQEIRDAYMNFLSIHNQQKTLVVNLENKKKELKTSMEELREKEKALALAKNTLEENEKAYEIIRPEIARAQEMDFKIEAAKEKITEINREIETYKKRKTESEETVLTLKKQESFLKETTETLSRWFVKYESYKDIIPKTDLVINLIHTIHTLKVQQLSTTSSLKTSNEIVSTYHTQLKQYEQEVERLNKILPAEIINLRTRLEEGKPCPVCGSLTHPLHVLVLEQEDKIDEKELEASKKRVADAIEQLKENIEKNQRNIIAFETCLKNFQEQYIKAFGDLKESVCFIPDWENKLESDTLETELLEISTYWNHKIQQLEACKQQKESCLIRLEAENKALNHLSGSLKEKEETAIHYRKTLNLFLEERRQLLANKKVEEVEKEYLITKKQLTEQYESLRNVINKTEGERATLVGTINQLTHDKKQHEEQLMLLKEEILTWLENKKDQISSALLKELLAKSVEWINQEKSYLNRLKEQQLTSRVTLKERESKLEKHTVSEDKPHPEETREVLSLRFQEINDKKEMLEKRATEIGVLLRTHEQAREKLKTLEKELHEVTELYMDWAKLNDLLGSASGNKFKTLAQGYTLDILLNYANKHLEQLTKRYKLEKIAGTLALQIIDNDMLGEARTVYSLSGGESFLISLALALGLSSLSSNKMKIEYLFIDEGFGALDIDTLDIAMNALDNLQTQGRKIGVISHVEEMKERISTQIRVTKSVNGKSYIQIVG